MAEVPYLLLPSVEEGTGCPSGDMTTTPLLERVLNVITVQFLSSHSPNDVYDDDCNLNKHQIHIHLWTAVGC